MTSGSRDSSAGKPQIVNVNYFRHKRLHLFFSCRELCPRRAMFTRSEVINPLVARRAIFARTASKEYRAGFVDSLSREGDRGPCRARRCQDGVLLRCNRADGETPETVADSRPAQEAVMGPHTTATVECLTWFSIKLTTTCHKNLRCCLTIPNMFFFPALMTNGRNHVARLGKAKQNMIYERRNALIIYGRYIFTWKW